MAEEFKGITRSVHGSNGLVHDLLEAWIVIGKSLNSSNEATELISFLRNRLSLGDGGRAWNISPSNSELRRFEDWKILAQILAECAAELSFENSTVLSSLHRINCLSSDNKEREHRVFLIAWNLDFLDLINETLAVTGFVGVGQRSMHLSAKEIHEVQLNVLFAHKRDLKNRNANDRLLSILDETLQLVETELPDKLRQNSDLLQEKGELLELCGRSSDALAAYRAAVEVEPDANLKQALIEFVEEFTAAHLDL